MDRQTDALGGVFVPVPGKSQRPVYSYGQAEGQTREVMFTCPIWAIPPVVFELLNIWWECRLNRVLPVAGGWLDQPREIRMAFPVFESEMRKIEQKRAAAAPQAAAAAAVAGMVAAAKR